MDDKGEIQAHQTRGDSAVTEPPPAQCCANHSNRPAKWFCNRCGVSFCDECVRVRDFTTFEAHFCRRCGDQCSPVQPPRPGENKSFIDELAKVWLYPVQGKGLYVLIGGTIFFTLMTWLLGTRIIILHPGTGIIFGILQLILALIFLGYLFEYAFKIVGDSAGGEDEPPDWPDFGDPLEFMRPLGVVIASLVMCFLPITAYTIAVAADVAAPSALLSWLLVFIGILLLPMALLSVALYDSLAALNPVHLVRSILGIGPAYMASVVMLVAVVLLGYLLQVRGVLNVPVLGTLTGTAVFTA